ncbi:MAG: hypothetical protein ACOC1O_06280 [bacterium]
MSLTNSNRDKYFELHNLNKKSLENAIKLIKEDIKNSYRKECADDEYIIKSKFDNKRRKDLINNIRSYNRILFGLMVSWSDESIRRLFYERDVFSENQIDYLLTNKPLEQKWKLALKISFCKAYNLIPSNNENCSGLSIRNLRSTLTTGLIDKHEYIKELIINFLIPAFDIRNKVQHGEWIAAFRPPYSKEYDRELTSIIFKENIVTINARMIIFNSVYQMIIDLARFRSGDFKIDPSLTPFEYFYNQHINKIEDQVNKIRNPELNKYIETLIAKKQRGKKYRKNKCA